MKCLRKRSAALLIGGLATTVIALFALPAAAQAPAAGRKFAFLVGVKKYTHGKLQNLDYPENDVEELAATLSKQGFKTLLLTTRLGQTDPSSMPTEKNIWSSLQTFIRENKPTKADLMLIGLAGHGMQPLGSDESYFCPSDANPSIKEGTKNSPANPETLISIGDLLKFLDDSGVGYKLLVVDACRNDPSVRGRRGVDHVNVAALPEQTGVLLSCKAGEFSFEHKSFGRHGHGAFFYQVIKGLNGAARDNDGEVTCDNLASYVRKKVPSTVRELFGTQGGEQNPNLIGNINGEPAVLARITTGIRTRQPETDAPELLDAPFDENAARAKRIAWARYRHVREAQKNKIGMEFVLIPAGRFSMGSPETPEELLKVFPFLKEKGSSPQLRKKTAMSLKGRSFGEQPVHRVTISRPFYLGKYAVTKGQFKTFVDETHYRTDAEKDGKGGYGYTGGKDKSIRQRVGFTWREWGVNQSDQSPVVNVSYNDATEFCEWLSRKERKKYRLPTEAEWEYACRAGTTGRYYNFDDPEALTKIGNVADASVKGIISDATVESSDGYPFTCPVGKFPPNNFGLYDMIGNVRVWCSDWYDPEYYSNSPDRDPTGPSSGNMRVLRGAGWASDPWQCRAARRGHAAPWYQHNHLGFRLAISAG
jgi:formylglycine-generating enzyme